MKKVCLFPLVLLFFTIARGQTATFKVVELISNLTVTNNAVFYEKTIPLYFTQTLFNVTNLSSATQTINLKKIETLTHKVGPGDSAAAQFCVDFYCFGPDTYTTPIVLTPGQTMQLHLQLKEASIITESIINYRFTNATNPNEILKLTIKYNSKDAPPALSVFENDPVIPPGIFVYPNPVSSISKIRVYSQVGGRTDLIICNAAGSVVTSIPVFLSGGENTLDLPIGELSAGVYYISLTGSSYRPVGKFIVLK